LDAAKTANSENAVGQWHAVQLRNGQIIPSQAVFFKTLFRSFENPHFNPLDGQQHLPRSTYEESLPMADAISEYTRILNGCLATHKVYGQRMAGLPSEDKAALGALIAKYLEFVAERDPSLGGFYERLDFIAQNNTANRHDEGNWDYALTVMRQTSCADEEWEEMIINRKEDPPAQDIPEAEFHNARLTFLEGITRGSSLPLPRAIHHHGGADGAWTGPGRTYYYFAQSPPEEISTFLATLSSQRGASLDDLFALHIFDEFRESIFIHPYAAFQSPREIFLNKTTPSFDLNNQAREKIHQFISWEDLGMAHYTGRGFFRPQRWVAEFQHNNPLGFAIIPVLGSMWDALDAWESGWEGREASGRPTSGSLQAGIFVFNLVATIGDFADVTAVGRKGLKYLNEASKFKITARNLRSVTDVQPAVQRAQDMLDTATDVLREDALSSTKRWLAGNHPFGHPKFSLSRFVNRSLGYKIDDLAQQAMSKQYDEMAKAGAALIETMRQTGQTSYDTFKASLFERFTQHYVASGRKPPKVWSTADALNTFTFFTKTNKYEAFYNVIRSTALRGRSDYGPAAYWVRWQVLLGAYSVSRPSTKALDLTIVSKQIKPVIRRADGREFSYNGARVVWAQPNNPDNLYGVVKTGVDGKDGSLGLEEIDALKNGWGGILHHTAEFEPTAQARAIITQEVARYQNELFIKAIDPKTGPTETVRLVAEIFYHDMHLYRYSRGTASDGLLTLHALLQSKGIVPGAQARNMTLDIAAMTSESFEDFFDIFKNAWAGADDLPYKNIERGWGLADDAAGNIDVTNIQAEVRTADKLSADIPADLAVPQPVFSFINGVKRSITVPQADIFGTLKAVTRVIRGNKLGLLIEGQVRSSLDIEPLTELEAPQQVDTTSDIPIIISIERKDTGQPFTQFYADVHQPLFNPSTSTDGRAFSFFIPEESRSSMSQTTYQVYGSQFGEWKVLLGEFTPDGMPQEPTNSCPDPAPDIPWQGASGSACAVTSCDPPIGQPLACTSNTGYLSFKQSDGSIRSERATARFCNIATQGTILSSGGVQNSCMHRLSSPVGSPVPCVSSGRYIEPKTGLVFLQNWLAHPIRRLPVSVLRCGQTPSGEQQIWPVANGGTIPFCYDSQGVGCK
jgi:hypothetical protein